MRITGQAGRLTVSGRMAAELGAWQAEPLPAGGWKFTAAVNLFDAYWCEQGPFTFTGDMGARAVIWRGVQASIVGSPISMTAPDKPEWR